ncbi:MAG: HD domain-containing protein [Firmicutes bacterium]|nr:HD domain-containing protein [Bacillota bacterium]
MQKQLMEYKTGEKVLGFFLLKTSVLRTSNKGGEYLDMVIADQSGDMIAKVWDLNNPDVQQARDITGRQVVKIKAVITDWNGQRQAKIQKIRKITPEDPVNTEELVPSAPMDGKDMYREILEKARAIGDPDFRTLTTALLEENRERLEYFPAATRNHHAVKGGLLYHVYRMLLTAEAVCGIYPVLSRDILYCGVILHDIAKLDEIDSNELGMAENYTFEGQMLGHIVQGIKIIDAKCRALGTPDEKRVMVEHMILSHHFEPEFGSPKKPMFPEAEMLHFLDLMDARMYDIEKSLEGVAPGGFSDKIYSMDNRKMYKPVFEEE